MLLYTLIVCFLPILVFGILECLDHIPLTRFYKVKSCRRSKQRIVGAANFANLSQCVEYAKQRKALAFNFSPITSDFTGREIGYASSCQLLGCPEVGNFTNLMKDMNYDYYSVFGNVSTIQNTTCIKSVGLFYLIKEKRNYTEAISFCQQRGGDLAHVLSEARTQALSNIILNEIEDWYKAAYVGLDDTRTEGLFQTPLGAPLSCFKFRAWAPGHPRNKSRRDDCVILDHERNWRVINCKHKLSFICELYPEEINNEDNLLGKPNCTHSQNKAKPNKCLEAHDLYQNLSRAEVCALSEDEDTYKEESVEAIAI